LRGELGEASELKLGLSRSGQRLLQRAFEQIRRLDLRLRRRGKIELEIRKRAGGVSRPGGLNGIQEARRRRGLNGTSGAA
jgi:hypothetical protein